MKENSKNINFELIRSSRKTISLTVNREMKTIVRAPLKMPLKTIESFITCHEGWIEKQKTRIAEYIEKTPLLTAEQTTELRDRAKQLIPQKVKTLSQMMNLKANTVKITSAKTRWGSCSGKNSLSFTFRIMLLPEHLIDYVIIHELAHIREKNHSRKFYDIIEKYLPDYKNRISQIKQIEKFLPR